MQTDGVQLQKERHHSEAYKVARQNRSAEAAHYLGTRFKVRPSSDLCPLSPGILTLILSLRIQKHFGGLPPNLTFLLTHAFAQRLTHPEPRLFTQHTLTFNPGFFCLFPTSYTMTPLSATLCISVFMTSWVFVGIQTSSVVPRLQTVASIQNLLPVQSKTGKIGLQGTLWESQRTEG